MSPTYLTARVIWTAMLAGLAAYPIMLAITLRQTDAAPAADVGTMRSALVAISAVALGVILFLRRRLPSTEGDPARDAVASATERFITYVVCWALSESIALYGLVLGFLSRRLDDALPFVAAGAVLLWWQRPRPEHLGA